MARRIFEASLVFSLAAAAPLVACGGVIKTSPEDASLPVDAAAESAVVPIADAGAAQEASPPPFDASALDPKVFGKCINESYMFWVESGGAFGPVGPNSVDATTVPWVGFVEETSVGVSVAGGVWGLRARWDGSLPPGTYTLSTKSLASSLDLTVDGHVCGQGYVGTFTIAELASTVMVSAGPDPLQRLLIGFDTTCGMSTVRGCMSFGR